MKILLKNGSIHCRGYRQLVKNVFFWLLFGRILFLDTRKPYPIKIMFFDMVDMGILFSNMKYPSHEC